MFPNVDFCPRIAAVPFPPLKAMAMKYSSAPVLAALLSLMSALSQAAPTINTPPASITPQYGTTAVLSASVTAEPGATFAWLRDGTTPIINGGRYSGAGTATLTITGVNSADNGSYVLTVTDGTGSTPATPATINVTQTTGSLDPAYNGAGANSGGVSSSIYTIGALHLPDGRSLLAVKNQFNGIGVGGIGVSTATSNLVVMSAVGAVVSHPGAASFVGGSNGGDVSCVFRMGDGKILLGGDFTTHRTDTIVNTPRNRVARLNADLTLDTTFVPTGPAAAPSVIFADSYGRIYLGGTFTNYDGLTGYQFLVRLKGDGTLDQSFKPILNGVVTGVALQKDGKFIIGGGFTSYGASPSTSAAGLVRFNADGSIDTGYTPALPVSSTNQNGLALDDADNLYLARSNPNVSITKLLPDGSAAPGFAFTLTPNAPLAVLAVQPGGKLAACGTFTTPVSRLLRINTGDGSPDTSFGITTGITTTSGSTFMRGLSSDSIGRLWVFGQAFNRYNDNVVAAFAVIQGSAGPQLAFTAQPTGGFVNQGGSVTLTAHATGNNGFTQLWHRNGSPLSNGGRFSGVDTNSLTITALEQGDEASYTLVVSSPGATSITSRVANLDVLGAPEITLDPVSTTVDFGGTVTLTGAATGASTLTYEWRYNGNPLSNGTGVSGATTDTLVLTNVDFNDAGHYTLRAINGLGNDTSTGATLTVQKRPGGIAGSANPLPMFNGEVHAVCLLPDGSYVIGGGFQTMSMNNGSTFPNRSRLARVLADGTLDANFPTAGGTVYCVELDSAGKIFIGGGFTSVTSGGTTTSRTRVARLVASGASYALDTAFDTSTAGPNDNVISMAPVGDGSVYIAGEFNKVGATADTFKGDDFVVRLGPNGALATSFTSGASNDTYALLRNSNGSLYVGGTSNLWNETTLFPGTPFRRLILVSAAGARIASFVPPGTFPIYPIPHTLLRLADGSILVGSNSGAGNPYVLRVNASTGAAFPYTTNHTITVSALGQQPDGKVLIGSILGNFTRNSAVDGMLDTTMDIGTGFNSAINDIKVDAAGRIFVVGNFTQYNGITRNRFVILNGGDLDSRSQPKPGQTITFPDIADRAFVPGNVVANTVTITLPTSSSGLPVTTVVTSGPATLNGNKLTITGAGTVMLTATQAGNDDFSAASIAETFNVSKASQTLTFEPMVDRPAGSAPFLLTASLSSGLPVVYSIVSGPATVSGNVLTLTGATGIVSVQASHPGNADFLPVAPDISRSFQVFAGTAAPLPQTIVFNPLPPRSANELPFMVSATSTSGLPVTLTVTAGGTIASINAGLVTLSGLAGNVTLTATQAGNASFLAAKPVTQTFKVNAAATTLTLTNLIQTYTGTAREIGVVGGTATTIYYTVNKIKGTTAPTTAGSYPVEAVSGTGPTAIKKTGTLVINKAPLLVVADDKRKFIGQLNPPLTFAYSGFLGSDHAGNAFTKAPTITTKATTTSPGGNYPITPAGGAAANYVLVYVSGNLKIESWAGQYEAILPDPTTNLPVAKIEFTVTASSRDITGKLTTAKQTAAVPFKGTLGLDFFSEYGLADLNAIVGKGQQMVVYHMVIDMPLNADFSVTVTRQEGPGPAVNFGTIASGKKLQLYSGKPPVDYAGAHTVIFAPDSTPNVLPKPNGYGHATAAIDAKGKLTLVGMLADGTKITAALLPDGDAGYRLYLLPYKGRLDSYCASWIEPGEHPDLPGRGIITADDMLSLYWAKAAGIKDANYRGGIPESTCRMLLDPWLPPVTKTPITTLPQRLELNGTGDIEVFHEGSPGGLTFPGAGLPALVQMNPAGKVIVPVATPPNPTKWQLLVTPATGAFTGSHNALDGTKSVTVKYTGVMRQPPSTEAAPELIGAGFGIVPQLTGQTAGTTSTSIEFERP